MLSISISLPLDDEDRAFLQDLLSFEARQVGPQAKKASPRASKPEEAPEPPAKDDEFEELSKQAHARAKELLDTKDPEQVAIVKAALDKVGLERVTHMETVKQVKTFIKALG